MEVMGLTLDAGDVGLSRLQQRLQERDKRGLTHRHCGEEHHQEDSEARKHSTGTERGMQMGEKGEAR